MKLPQLHIRDLFWLVLVTGMGCAWWTARREQASISHQRDHAVGRAEQGEQEFRRRGCTAMVDANEFVLVFDPPSHSSMQATADLDVPFYWDSNGNAHVGIPSGQ